MNAAGIDTDAAAIEAAIKPLIEEHGYEKVREHIGGLLEITNWDAWQRLDNIARNVANRMKKI